MSPNAALAAGRSYASFARVAFPFLQPAHGVGERLRFCGVDQPRVTSLLSRATTATLEPEQSNAQRPIEKSGKASHPVKACFTITAPDGVLQALRRALFDEPVRPKPTPDS